MIADRIAELAVDVGARLPEQLPPDALVAIEVDREARLVFETAAGDRWTFVGGGELTADQVLALLIPEHSAASGAVIVAGTKFSRCPTPPLHRLIFREVGR